MQRSILDLIKDGEIQQVTDLIERGEPLDLATHSNAIKLMVLRNIDAEKLLAFIDMLQKKGCENEHIIRFTLPFEFKLFTNKNIKEDIYKIIAANPDADSITFACKRALDSSDPLGYIIQLHRPHREFGAHKGIIKNFQQLLVSSERAGSFHDKDTELNLITTSAPAAAVEATVDFVAGAQALTFTVLATPELPQQFAGDRLLDSNPADKELFLILRRMFDDQSAEIEFEIAEFVRKNERLRCGPELSGLHKQSLVSSGPARQCFSCQKSSSINSEKNRCGSLCRPKFFK